MIISVLFIHDIIIAQTLEGNIYDKNSVVSFANVLIEIDNESIVVSSDIDGNYKADNLTLGKVKVLVWNKKCYQLISVKF